MESKMCDFCKIIEKKIDAFIIHETDKNIVFWIMLLSMKGMF